MSRFDDLDHRLGRHEGKPHPDCSVCNPALPKPVFTARWDFESPGAPAFPDWGSLWQHRGEVLVFINPDWGWSKPVTKGGFWVPVIQTLLASKWPGESPPMSTVWGPQPKQMEFGSGQWAPRVHTMMYQNMIPDEAGLSSPLGVDLVKWAETQNHAKLIVGLSKSREFPISEVRHERSSDSATRATIIRSSVRTIPVQGLETFLSS